MHFFVGVLFHRSHTLLFSLSLSICLLPLFPTRAPHLVSADLVNITVDDTNPDPLTGFTFSYLPTDRWNVGNGCVECLAKPDPGQTFDATWHDATFNPALPESAEVQTASFQFNGSAIYVYGILSHSQSNPNSTADLSFFIDDEPTAEGFTFVPPGDDGFTFNALLYANDSIPSGSHSFTLQNGRPGGILSLVLLDYIIYTREEEPTSVSPPSSLRTLTPSTLQFSGSGGPGSHHGSGNGHNGSHGMSHTLIIVVVVVVLVVVLLVVLLLVLLYLRRRRSAARGREEEEESVGEVKQTPPVSRPIRPSLVIPFTPSAVGDGMRVVPQAKGQRPSATSDFDGGGPSNLYSPPQSTSTSAHWNAAGPSAPAINSATVLWHSPSDISSPQSREGQARWTLHTSASSDRYGSESPPAYTEGSRGGQT